MPLVSAALRDPDQSNEPTSSLVEELNRDSQGQLDSALATLLSIRIFD